MSNKVAPEEFKFIVAPGPHLKDKSSTPNLMLWVIIALLPVTVMALITFKVAGFIVITGSLIGAIGAEALWHKVSKKPITILDGSAAVTGLLLALTLPPKLPWWLPMIGGFVAITVAKFIFGGLGFNIFNPALVARAVLVLSWPSLMTTSYLEPFKVDAKTSASPLFIAKQVRIHELPAAALKVGKFIEAFIFTNKAAVMGEVSAVLILVGGLILIAKRIIDWKIPVFFVATVVVLTVLAKGEPLFYLLAGGLLFGAFFMATDYVTSSITGRGKMLFGMGAGLVTFLIRFYSNLPEGVMFSILFMNTLAPLIDKYTLPRMFGKVKA